MRKLAGFEREYETFDLASELKAELEIRADIVVLAVDPTIAIGAPVVTGEDSYGIGTHPVPNPNQGGTTHVTSGSFSVRKGDILSHTDEFERRDPGPKSRQHASLGQRATGVE